MKKFALLLLIVLASFHKATWGASTVINSFNSGELSPLLRGRSDVRKYYSGCETLENMVVLPYGGVEKRPGTYYIADAKNSSLVCRLVPFEYSTVQAYVLELGNEYVRFYKDGGQILTGVGTDDLSGVTSPAIAAHYLLDDASGISSAVVDDDGATHNGVLSDAADTAIMTATVATGGYVGTGCFDLDGQYCVIVSDSADFTFSDGAADDAFSGSCWVYVADASVLQVLMSKWRDNSSVQEWRFSLTADRELQLHLADNTSNVEADRIAHWKLNEDASDQIVLDDDATSHDGLTETADTDVLTATGKVGKCFNFAAADCVIITNDHAELSFDDSGSNPFSIVVWGYYDGYPYPQVLFSKWDATTGAQAREYYLQVDGFGDLEFRLLDESVNVAATVSTNDAVTAGWHCFVATYDSTGGASAADGMTLYIDNVAVGTTAYNHSSYVAMENTATTAKIGAVETSSGSLGAYWRDKIDNVMLFSAELNVSQVGKLWNDGDGTEDLSATNATPYAVTDGAITTGWHFLGFNYDKRQPGSSAASGINLYVDGSVVGRTAYNDDNYTAMQDTAEEFRIGAQRNSGDTANEDFWEDKIDGVALFSEQSFGVDFTAWYSTTPYDINTPYGTSDLFDIQYVQSADVMYFVHPDYVPRSLTRTEHNLWTLTEVDYTEGPFLPENITTTTITPSAATGATTLTASAALFDEDDVGSHIQISHYISAVEIAGQVTANHDSASLTVYKGQDYDFETDNTWVGKTTLQRSYDAGSTWFDVIPYTSGTSANVTYAGVEELDDAIYRVHYVDSSGTMEYSVIAHSFKRDGIVEITSYTSSTVVDGTVTRTLGSTGATEHWSEAAWSTTEGYPSCIVFYEERQAFANTKGSPQTIWFSETDNWDAFLEGVDTTDSINRTIAANQVNAIKWLAPQTSLMFGTTGSEWKLYASGSDEPLAPDNTNVKRQSGHGSNGIQALVMNNSIIFVQRQDEIVRKLQYSFDIDGWIAPDLTLLAEHITGDGITQIALQKTPYPILWCVREDGKLAGLTMEESQEVLGWHGHEFSGDVESVAVIPGSAEDEVWLSIERTIDSSTVRYIEQMQPVNWGSNQKEIFFVDSGLSFDGGDAVVISGVSKADPAVITATAHGLTDGSQIRVTDVVGMVELNENVYSVGTIVNANSFQLRTAADDSDIVSTGFTTYVSDGTATWVENNFTTLTHLEGETVSVTGDGGYYGQEPVSSATITLDDYYNRVHAGLPYTSKVKPMKLEMPGQPGALFGVTQRITEITLRLDDTLDCEVGYDWDNTTAFAFRGVLDPLEAAPPLYTGDKVISYEGDYDRVGEFYLQSTKPLPWTLISLKAEFEAYP